MTVAFVEQSAESLTNAQQRKNPQKNATGSELFSSLLDGRLPPNIVFTRADAALAPPQGAEKQESDKTVTPYRDDSRDEPMYDDDVTQDPVDNDHYDVAGNRPVQQDTSRSDSSDQDQAAVAAQPTNTNAEQQAAEARRTSQNHQGDTTAQARTEAAATSSDTAKSATTATIDPNAAAAKAKTDTATTKIAVDPALQRAAEVTPEVADAVKKHTQNNSPLRAYVSRAADPVTAQTQSSLSAQASVTAQETTDTKALNTALKDAGLATLAEGEALASEGTGKTKVKTGIISGAKQPGQEAQNANQSQQQGPDLSALAAQAAQNQQISAAAAANVQQSANSFTNAQAGQSMAIDASAGTGQLNGTTAGAQQRAAVAQAHTPNRPHVPHQALADQVAVQINKAAENGLDRINIQLRPADLGRVDVKMEVGHDGRVAAVISVERQETLDMLRQDSRILTQALQDAGLQADQSSLSFNLQGQQGQSADANGTSGGTYKGVNGDEQADVIDDGLLAMGETAELTDDGRLDVKV